MTKARTTRQMRCASGFTLAELIIGLAIMVLIGGAVAALAGAAGQSWQASESTQSLVMTVRQSGAQIERMIRSSKAVGLATADGQVVLTPGTPVSANTVRGADLMMWTGDTDGVMKLGEVVLIRHDTTTNSLFLYQVKANTATAATTAAITDIDTSAEADSFVRLADVSKNVLASGVTSASFKLIKQSTAWQYPAVEMVLVYKIGDATRTVYRTVTLRAPS